MFYDQITQEIYFEAFFLFFQFYHPLRSVFWTYIEWNNISTCLCQNLQTVEKIILINVDKNHKTVAKHKFKCVQICPSKRLNKFRKNVVFFLSINNSEKNISYSLLIYYTKMCWYCQTMWFVTKNSYIIKVQKVF